MRAIVPTYSTAGAIFRKAGIVTPFAASDFGQSRPSAGCLRFDKTSLCDSPMKPYVDPGRKQESVRFWSPGGVTQSRRSGCA